tara:strand:- start:2581 stop:3558 length:978 start_codon:yes stop_codon:yes gene_type:complete
LRFKNNIVVSLGEPSGIGAEVFLKAICKSSLVESLDKIVVCCDPKIIIRMLKKLSIPLEINTITETESNYKKDCLNILNVQKCGDYVLGSPSALNADYVVSHLEAAAKLASKNKASLVTGPINKNVIAEKYLNFSGHTEYLSNLFSSKNILMVLANPKLKVGLVTTHIPLSEVPKTITMENIYKKGVLFAKGLTKYFGIKAPKICILGLNPHSGEKGMIGNEEISIISPGIEMLCKNGINAFGPLPADTAFIKNSFDGFLSMYHDQSLPVIKTLDFERTINVTFGLPFLRTSVDHGTAEDIANEQVASHISMLEALKLAGNVPRI